MNKFLVLLICISLFAGCKKTTHYFEETLSVTDTNLRASYRITEVTLNGSSIIYTYLQPCQMDNVYVFYGGAYFYYDEGIQCTPVLPSSGTYSFTATQLTLDGILYNIDSLTGGALVLSRTVGTNKYVLTFSRK